IVLSKLNKNGLATSQAFFRGALTCGDKPFLIALPEEIKEADVYFAVTTPSIYKGKDFNLQARQFAQKNNIRMLYADVGFVSAVNKREDENNLDRYLAISYDGIKREGKYLPDLDKNLGLWPGYSVSDRFDQLGLEIKPYIIRPRGYILILGQNYTGLSVQNFDYGVWLQNTVNFLKPFGPLLLRPHPAQTKFP